MAITLPVAWTADRWTLRQRSMIGRYLVPSGVVAGVGLLSCDQRQDSEGPGQSGLLLLEDVEGLVCRWAATGGSKGGRRCGSSLTIRRTHQRYTNDGVTRREKGKLAPGDSADQYYEREDSIISR